MPPSGDFVNNRRSNQEGGEGSLCQVAFSPAYLSVGARAHRTSWAEGMVGERDAGPDRRGSHRVRWVEKLCEALGGCGRDLSVSQFISVIFLMTVVSALLS